MNARTLPEKGDEWQSLLREVKYRLSYRGTLELDTLCRRLLAKIDGFEETRLREIRDFLLHGENELMWWLVDGVPAPAEHAEMVKLFKQ